MKPHIVVFYGGTQYKVKESQMLPLSAMYAVHDVLARGYTATIIDEQIDTDWRETLRREFAERDVVLFGVSSFVGTQIRGGLEAARIVRQMSPKTPIVWGGLQASLFPEQTTRHPLVDIAVIGEGEKPFADLADAFYYGTDWRGIPNLAYVDEEGNFRKNPENSWVDLDEQKPPYHLVDVSQYTKAPLQDFESVAIVTSRGCPWRCGFCYTLAHNRRTWRAMSPERVVEEFKYVKEVLGVRDLFLFDDEFFIDHKRVAAIADLLEKENLDMRLHNVNCRAGSLCRMDMGLLKKMRRVGLHYILVGVESGSPRVLDSMKKDMTVEEVIEANQRCIEADITPYFSFMCGFPQETEEDVRLTLKLQERLLRDNPRAMVSKTVFYYPFPGTPMFEEAVQQYGFEAPQSLEEWATYIDSPKHYRNVPEEQQAFARDAAIFTVFLDTKFIEIKNPVLRLLANVYSFYLRTAIRYDFLGRRPLGMTALRGVYHWWHKRKGLLEE